MNGMLQWLLAVQRFAEYGARYHVIHCICGSSCAAHDFSSTAFQFQGHHASTMHKDARLGVAEGSVLV